MPLAILLICLAWILWKPKKVSITEQPEKTFSEFASNLVPGLRFSANFNVYTGENLDADFVPTPEDQLVHSNSYTPNRNSGFVFEALP